MQKKKKKIPIELKLRQVWLINPVERVKQSKKIYNRKRDKLELKKIVQKISIIILFCLYSNFLVSDSLTTRNIFPDINYRKLSKINKVKNYVIIKLIEAENFIWSVDNYYIKLYQRYGYNTQRFLWSNFKTKDVLVFYYVPRKKKVKKLVIMKIPVKLRWYVNYIDNKNGYKYPIIKMIQKDVKKRFKVKGINKIIPNNINN